MAEAVPWYFLSCMLNKRLESNSSKFTLPKRRCGQNLFTDLCFLSCLSPRKSEKWYQAIKNTLVWVQCAVTLCCCNVRCCMRHSRHWLWGSEGRFSVKQGSGGKGTQLNISPDQSISKKTPSGFLMGGGHKPALIRHSINHTWIRLYALCHRHQLKTSRWIATLPKQKKEKGSTNLVV